MKKVAASGTKLTAYAVQVFSGGKLEAEYYSSSSLKPKVQAAAASVSEAQSFSNTGGTGTPPKKPAKKK